MNLLRAMPCRWLVAWLCAVWLMGSVATAWAAPRKDEGKELADEAAERFKSQHFVDAAELFERAYALNPEKLVRLRNAGRAWEEAGRLDQARHLFRRYIELMPEGTDRAEVRVRLARIESRLAPAPAKAPAAAEPEAVPAAAAPPPPQMVAVAEDHEAVRTGAWTLTGAGIAALGVGIGWIMWVGTVDTRYQDDLAQHRYDYAPGGAAKAESDRKAIALNKPLAWTTTGIGAAAAVGGLVWALWPHAKPTAVALSPWTSRGEVGVAAAVRF